MGGGFDNEAIIMDSLSSLPAELETENAEALRVGASSIDIYMQI